MADIRSDLDLLDEQDLFEIDAHAAHLFKRPHLGVDDVEDVGLVTRCSTRPSRRRALANVR